MIYSLPKVLRRVLAVGLLLGLMGALGAFAVGPVWSHIADLQDRIEQARMMAGRLAAAANDDGARKMAEQQTMAAKKAGVFIEGESESIRLSALQSQLSGMVAAQGVKLRSARNLPGREKNDLRLIGVQLQMVVTIDRLQKLMLEIEQHKPTFIIESLQVTPLNVPRLPDDEQVGQLDARLDVFAIEAKQKG